MKFVLVFNASYLFVSLDNGWTALEGLDLIIVEVSISHSDTPRSVELLWTSERPLAETST
jgi:hypothetical protein